MTTVLFDFDSTLITCESLEEILRPLCRRRPEIMGRIEALTDAGMAGKLSFAQSLAQRLQLAAPTRAQVTAFGNGARSLLTEGMEELVKRLFERDVEVRIVSGGLREAILPVAGLLGITPDRVHAVRLLWSSEGDFLDIDENDPFSRSKLAGALALAHSWPRPLIAIGDGMTDYHLKSQGLADHFIGFVGNQKRKAVVALNQPMAENSNELWNHLEGLL